MASLSIRSDVGEETIPLESKPLTLGRGLECDIRLKDIRSSRRHCQIVASSEGYRLIDLGSGNGTYLNAVLVKGEQPLRNGDKIQIGSTILQFKSTGLPALPIPEVVVPPPPPPKPKNNRPFLLFLGGFVLILIAVLVWWACR